jgi:hypothetical protein
MKSVVANLALRPHFSQSTALGGDRLTDERKQVPAVESPSFPAVQN